MSILATVLIFGVVAVQSAFFVLENKLSQTDIGKSVFKQTAEQAAAREVLFKNMGVCNLTFAAMLVAGLIMGSKPVEATLLSGVIAMGIYGAKTVDRKVFFMQALPAMLALAAVLFTH